MFSGNKRKRHVCFGFFFYFLLVAFVRRIRFVVSQEFEFCFYSFLHIILIFSSNFFLSRELRKVRNLFQCVGLVFKLAPVWHTRIAAGQWTEFIHLCFPHSGILVHTVTREREADFNFDWIIKWWKVEIVKLDYVFSRRWPMGLTASDTTFK